MNNLNKDCFFILNNTHLKIRLKGDIIFELNNIYENVIFNKSFKKELKERLFLFLDTVVSSSNLNSISSIVEFNSLIFFENTEPVMLTCLFFKKYKQELFNSFNPLWYTEKINPKNCPKKYLLKTVFESIPLFGISQVPNFYFFQKIAKKLIYNYFFEKEIELQFINPLLFEDKKTIRYDTNLYYSPYLLKKIKGLNLPSSTLSLSLFNKKDKFVIPNTKHYKNINKEVPSSEDFEKTKKEFIDFLIELKETSIFNSYSFFFGYSGFRAEEFSLSPGKNYILKDKEFINVLLEGNTIILSKHYMDNHSLGYLEKIETFQNLINYLIEYLKDFNL